MTTPRVMRRGIDMRLLLALALLAASPAQTMVQPTNGAGGQTAAGVVYAQPKDWSLTTTGPATIFAAPEGDLKVAVVDVGSAADAQAAAAKAWTLYKPNASRTVRLASAAPAGDGWDERVSIAYETSPGERAVAAATAMRRGTSWTVVIVEGSEGTANKRSAALATLQQSLRPAGYKPETFAGQTAHRLTPDKVQALRDFVAQSARALEVPGVGLAFIDHGKVVWEGGIGVRALGSPEPVDAHTKFMIASNTKGMSTLLLSVLADEGKLRWDQRVVDLYPSFRLGDDATTHATLVRHLVCACTGLPRKDYSFILADPGEPPTATFDRLAQTQPTSKFGELYQYSNLLAAAAGYLGGSLAYPGMELGAAYDKAMQTRIFGPLGMHDTTFDFKVGESGDWARPHGYDVDGQMVVMSNSFNHLITPYRPAGGAWSSAADMARYVELELGKGVMPDGRRIVSEANILERRRHGVSIGEDAWYGMGLMERMVSGVRVVTHGGTLQGFHSTFYVLPDAGIGAVILTNADTGPAMFGPFLRRMLEVLYDGKPEAAQEVAVSAARLKAQAKVRRARLTLPGDPAVLAGLAKTYRNPADNGTIAIGDRGGGKWIKAGFVEGPVATRKNPDGTVSIVSAGPGAIGVEAVIGSRDGVRILTVREGQHEYVYSEIR
jgi:CubicO group peptidase (beta-lactamase class C family)